MLCQCAAAQSKRVEREPVSPATLQSFTKTEKVALLVGVEVYHPDTGLGRLQYSATTDLDGLEAELTEQRYYVLKLRNEEARRPKIRDKLRELGDKVKGDGGTILFYFSGHGGMGSDGANYLAVWDTPASQLKEEGFAVAEVARLLGESGAQRQVMLIDACRDAPPPPSNGKSAPVAPRMDAIQHSVGIDALYSTGKGQSSYEDKSIQHGTFTHYLIKGLHGDAAGPDGAVTFADLKRYIEPAVREHERKRGHLQEPRAAMDSTGDILLALHEVIVQPVADRDQLLYSLLESSNDVAKLELGAAQIEDPRLSNILRLRAKEIGERNHPPTPVARAPQPGDRKQNPIDGLNYVWIPAGQFQLGCSPNDKECDADEKPAKPVTIANAFRLGETEVPQSAYLKVIGNNPSQFKGPNLPVEQVTWNDAAKYCGAIGGRLPTEAEWEYAARAGATGPQYAPLDRIAWYSDNSGQTQDVKQKEPNSWGLYDMLGNVWEWTQSEGATQAIRGGSWLEPARGVRASYRHRQEPAIRHNDVGFRCAWE
jgi:formylglycine-generating enzyme required for sulfatase activity